MPFFKVISKQCEQHVALMGTYKKAVEIKHSTETEKVIKFENNMCCSFSATSFKNLTCIFVSPHKINLKILDFLHFETVGAHVNSQMFILSKIRI